MIAALGLLWPFSFSRLLAAYGLLIKELRLLEADERFHLRQPL